MATEITETEEVVLEDGTKATLKPLVIKSLRKFMKVWNTWIEDMEVVSNQREANDRARANDETLPFPKVHKLSKISDMEYEVYLDLAVICFAKELQGDKSDDTFKEYVEDNLAQDVMYKAFKRCAGLDLKTTEENLTNLMNETE